MRASPLASCTTCEITFTARCVSWAGLALSASCVDKCHQDILLQGPCPFSQQNTAVSMMRMTYDDVYNGSMLSLHA